MGPFGSSSFLFVMIMESAITTLLDGRFPCNFGAS